MFDVDIDAATDAWRRDARELMSLCAPRYARKPRYIMTIAIHARDAHMRAR